MHVTILKAVPWGLLQLYLCGGHSKWWWYQNISSRTLCLILVETVWKENHHISENGRFSLSFQLGKEDDTTFVNVQCYVFFRLSLLSKKWSYIFLALCETFWKQGLAYTLVIQNGITPNCWSFTSSLGFPI